MGFGRKDLNFIRITKSDVARPRPSIFSRPRPLFLKTIKLLNQDFKKRSLAEKIRSVMPVLPGHACICQ